jgi:hypothetical protein
MPPLKYYVFAAKQNDNIKIHIKTYNLEDALKMLDIIVYNPLDFEHISN